MKRTAIRLPQALPRALTFGLAFVVLGATTTPLAWAADTEQQAAQRDGIELVDGIQRSLEGPDVVITAGKSRTVYEYRQNGQLRLVKIVPKIGRPYYLVPADQTRGFGDLGQADMLLPQWTIIEF